MLTTIWLRMAVFHVYFLLASVEVPFPLSPWLWPSGRGRVQTPKPTPYSGPSVESLPGIESGRRRPMFLTVPWTHYVSKNCVHFSWHRSYLLCFYKLKCDRFNHIKVRFCRSGQLQPSAYFFRDWRMNLWNDFCSPRSSVPDNSSIKIRCMKKFIIIYFHV